MSSEKIFSQNQAAQGQKCEATGISADVTKRSGWRIHVQYGKDGRLHLKDILPPEKHDTPGKAVKAKKERYKQILSHT